jgi:hypothetical protein
MRHGPPKVRTALWNVVAQARQVGRSHTGRDAQWPNKSFLNCASSRARFDAFHHRP